MKPMPLVSVVIPAFKSVYFEAALASACQQTYPHLEIIIGDDSNDPQIAAVVDRFSKNSAICIRYQRNQQPLFELGNTLACIQRASGHYVKFLHDDDVLDPDCVTQLVALMERDPGIVLASSRRRRIDSAGQTLPDIPATCFPFPEDVQIDGQALVSMLVDHTLNFIGEPSCVLCRRSDLLALGDGLMSLNGVGIDWLGDLSLYVKLLQQGNLGFLARPLTDVRTSAEQFSQLGRDQPGIGNQGHHNFRTQIRALGWYSQAHCAGGVPVAPLGCPEQTQRVDILQRIHQAHAAGLEVERQQHWYAARVPNPVQARHIEQRLQDFQGGPLIGVVVLDAQGDAQGIRATLDSLQSVRRGYGAVCGFVLSPLAGQAEDFQDARFLALQTDAFADAINRIVEQEGCRWLLLLEAGDCLTASGLQQVALELLDDPECRVIYADALQSQADGTLSPVLRPDFNLDYLLSAPGLMARNGLYRCDAVQQAGGFDPGFYPALEFELMTRMINQQGLLGFGHVSEPLVINRTAGQADSPALSRTLLEHVQQRGYAQARIATPRPAQFKIDYAHQTRPLVSIVLILEGDLAALQRCVISLLEHTHYPHYELIVVDNGSTQPAADVWLEAIAQLLGERLQVLRLPTALGRASAINAGARQAQGDYLLLLRTDTVLIQGQWLDELLNHGQRPEVGVVGAKAVSAERRITHAGIILGLDSCAGHAFAGEPMNSAGYMNRLQVEQNYSAVSDVCLLIRKALFDAVGGLDSETFEQGAADIDLCLRVARQGFLTVWTPYAVLAHDHPPVAVPESVRPAFFQRWREQLPADPAYNSNLSLAQAGGFELADAQLSWQPLAWKPLPLILASPSDLRGCGHYRVIQPLEALKQAGQVDGALTVGPPLLMHLERYGADTLVLQRPLSEPSLAAARQYKAFSRAFKVYELDDYLAHLPIKSVHRSHMPKDVLRSLRRGLTCVDRCVVSTEALAETLKDFHPQIQVVHNRLDLGWWGALVRSERRVSARPRVGWAGGVGHSGDLEMIADVVKALADEVDWVFFGLCPERLRPYVKEFHPGIRIDLYPAALARLNLDLAVAPLEDNLFNACKSNLRLLEYGICGVPVVCSDLQCYRGDLPVTRVRNRFRDWVEAIRMHLHDLDAAGAAGDALERAVRRDWMLDKHGLQLWQKAWLAD